MHIWGLHHWSYKWLALSYPKPLRGGHPGGLAPPLYIHSTTQGGIQGRLREGSPETEWEQRVTQLFHSQVPSYFSSILPNWLRLGMRCSEVGYFSFCLALGRSVDCSAVLHAQQGTREGHYIYQNCS